MQDNRQNWFSPETIALLRATLDAAWDSLAPADQANLAKSLLAERLLKAAAKGERDPAKLLRAALAEDVAA